MSALGMSHAPFELQAIGNQFLKRSGHKAMSAL